MSKDYTTLKQERDETTRYVVTTQYEGGSTGISGAEVEGYAPAASWALAYAFDDMQANVRFFNRPGMWYRIDVYRIDTWDYIHLEDEDEDSPAISDEGDVLHFDTGSLFDETPEG